MHCVRPKLGEDDDPWLRLSHRLPMLVPEQPTALYRQQPHSIPRSARDINYEYLVLNRALALWGPGSVPDPGAMRGRLACSMFNHDYSHYKGGNAHCGAVLPVMHKTWRHPHQAPAPVPCLPREGYACVALMPGMATYLQAGLA